MIPGVFFSFFKALAAFIMSKFVLSSFVIGLGASSAAVFAVSDSLYDRKTMFDKKVDNSDLVEAYYQQVILLEHSL